MGESTECGEINVIKKTYTSFHFNCVATYLAIKAAATVLIFECLKRATTVRELPITPTIIVIMVITPAAANIGPEYL